MGATIEDLYEAFSQLRLRDELPELILATSYDIEVLVKAQLDMGELSTEQKIAPSYKSKYYAVKKVALNPTPGYGIPDVRVTGAYYKGIGVTVEGEDYSIESNVEYALSPQIAQYGPNLLRLSEGSKEAYCNEALSPAIEKYISNVTGLVFI
jgi:hypothetical protein